MKVGRSGLVRKSGSRSWRPLLVLAADEGPPPEERVVEGLEEVAGLRDEGRDLGAKVLRADLATNLGDEEGRLHLELKLKKLSLF